MQTAGIDVAVYDEVRVEPTDASFLDAARFAREGRFDAYVSVGGGSVIDTCKAAILYATYPADFLTYVNTPVGAGGAGARARSRRTSPAPPPAAPAARRPASPSATCSRSQAKTGIASARLRPSLALVDPACTATLPAEVVAASGFDVLCHALESYTARPYTARARPETPRRAR